MIGAKLPFRAESCDVDEFAALVERPTDPADYTFCDHVAFGAVVYSSSHLRARLGDATTANEVADEIGAALLSGPGIVVLRGAFDSDVVQPVTEAFFDEIEAQRTAHTVAGDHFGKAGANDRVWNAFEKLAVRAPEAFVDYYANDMVALVARSWLGPNYQISSQVNVVNPGGESQSPHRDFHLGFLTNDEAMRYPAHVHTMSPMLSLQGAVAHCDMPVETGPTLYLPHSQKYPLGYLAWRRPDFIDYFATHHVQVPLALGDLVFFNPALFHAAGSNRTSDVRRMANLLQISSGMSRTMESIDRNRIVRAVYPALLRRHDAGMASALVDNVVTASAEGYAFPTNLDRDPPLGGLTPPAEADTVRRAIAEHWDEARLADALTGHAQRRRSA